MAQLHDLYLRGVINCSDMVCSLAMSTRRKQYQIVCIRTGFVGRRAKETDGLPEGTWINLLPVPRRAGKRDATDKYCLGLCCVLSKLRPVHTKYLVLGIFRLI
jgi:hypothetical protein